jgi:hypothetical protein
MRHLDTLSDMIGLKVIDSRDLIRRLNELDGDWRHGEALILDSHFENYARELAEDIGMVDKSDQWPNRCIDWEQAAEELKQDYSSFEIDGYTYWMRS